MGRWNSDECWEDLHKKYLEYFFTFLHLVRTQHFKVQEEIKKRRRIRDLVKWSDR